MRQLNDYINIITIFMIDFSTLIERDIENILLKKIKPGKVLILTGARRVGKTILLKQILNLVDMPKMMLNGEDQADQLLLENRTVENYKSMIGNTKLLVIDEAQKIPDIGLKLKLMVDEIEGVSIIASGSSAFDLYNKTGEPLTGRKFTYNVFPFSENEFYKIEDQKRSSERLKQSLIYGNYPEVTLLDDLDDKREYLREIVNSYLLKDILIFDNIKYSTKIFALLRNIAYQIGQTVSYQELGQKLGMSKNTVEKYLDLLSKVFVVYKVEGFSSNLRKEITKSSRWYFYDNGVRNAIISNFSPIISRNDIGMLWENYMAAERRKYQHNNRMSVNNYFWRTYDKQEIDMIEERDGKLYGCEFKWSINNNKPPAAWLKAYPSAKYNVYNQFNYKDWVVNK